MLTASSSTHSILSEETSKAEALKLMDKQNTAESHNTNNMDSFLQRMRTDLMYELRNIRHGERPVTGQSHREHLQQFMEKHMMGFSDNSTSEKTNNIPSNVDDVERHRPDSVVVEVQAVVDLRPVSSVLQSVAFRRHLENVIRGSLGSRQPARNISDNRPRSSQRIASSGITSNGGVRSSPFIPASETIQLSNDRLQLARQESTESVESFSSARSSHEQDIDSDIEEVEERITSPERTQDSASARLEINAPATVTQSQERMASEEHEPRESNIWSNITTLQQEEIVEEISELLHSRLVSSTLEGEFRTVLELVAQEHLSSSGTNGRAVQDFISNLPHSGVQRNDFSRLGIAPVNDHDNWDNISVTSVSAHSVPFAQTNTYLGREIQSLKSQMNEMKNMLKLTFDLQMDLQRAVRQEVAAAMNNFTAQGATGITSSLSRPTGPVNDTHCLICLERHTDTVLYQCGHMCVCFVCGRDLLSRGHRCPVCRAPIKDVIRTYKTNAD